MHILLLSDKMQAFCFLLLLVSSSSSAHADRELSPYSYKIDSANNKYYFIMSPDKNEMKDSNKGTGIAYKKIPGNSKKQIWMTENWYALSTYLSNDGIYLVRLGNTPRGSKPSKNHLAIAIYKEGRLISSYSTSDLIRDDNKVIASSSHYRFLNKVLGFTDDYIFKIITIDDTEYTFDVRSGNLIFLNKK